MSMKKFVHQVIHGLGIHVLVDFHTGGVLMGASEAHCLTKLIVFVEACLSGTNDYTAASNEIIDSVAANSNGCDA